MDFKNLTDIDTLAEVSDNTKLIGLENGKAVQVSGDGLKVKLPLIVDFTQLKMNSKEATIKWSSEDTSTGTIYVNADKTIGDKILLYQKNGMPINMIERFNSNEVSISNMIAIMLVRFDDIAVNRIQLYDWMMDIDIYIDVTNFDGWDDSYINHVTAS